MDIFNNTKNLKNLKKRTPWQFQTQGKITDSHDKKETLSIFFLRKYIVEMKFLQCAK